MQCCMYTSRGLKRSKVNQTCTTPQGRNYKWHKPKVQSRVGLYLKKTKCIPSVLLSMQIQYIVYVYMHILDYIYSKI